VTYRAISDYFLKLNVAFFSHWRLEAHIPLQCYPNIGGDIPIDVPTNQNIGGDTSPASPAGLTPSPINGTSSAKYKSVSNECLVCLHTSLSL